MQSDLVSSLSIEELKRLLLRVRGSKIIEQLEHVAKKGSEQQDEKLTDVPPILSKSGYGCKSRTRSVNPTSG